MRYLTILSLIFVLGITLEVSQAYGQSGSRGGGSGSRGGSSGVRSTGGGGGSSSRSAGSSRRGPSAAELERQRELAQAQLEAQQAQAVELQKARFVETLSQLGEEKFESKNKKQNRQAINEAKRDYRALKKGDVSPEQLGGLQVPFRLTMEEIDREKRTIKWPDTFEGTQYQTLVDSIDETIGGGDIEDEAAAKAFLGELKSLSTVLNTDVVSGGELSMVEFAEARRLLTGLGNEVLSAGLGLK